jgi:hypothetical protein
MVSDEEGIAPTLRGKGFWCGPLRERFVDYSEATMPSAGRC